MYKINVKRAAVLLAISFTLLAFLGCQAETVPEGIGTTEGTKNFQESAGNQENSLSAGKPTPVSESAEALEIYENPAGPGPQPGDIFREYVWRGPFINALGWQRVTDPGSKTAEAQKALPNPVNTVEITDLEGAIRAEMVIEQWGGHSGTSKKRVRINGNRFIYIPESNQMGPEVPEAYSYHKYPCIRIPMEHLKQNSNTFEFRCDGQIFNDFGWGQWGVYGVIFRIYYESSKPHPTGKITSPGNGDSIGEICRFEAETASGGSPVARVDFLGFYEDFDENGDGIYTDWHYNFRYGEIQRHIGTAEEGAPYKVSWDTSWVPDQIEPMKFAACITDESGICYMSEIVENVSLTRKDQSVKMYKPYDVPTKWQTRDGMFQSCKADVQDDLSKAVQAKMILRTWSGLHADEIGINDNKVVERIGNDHNYSHDEIDVPLKLIRKGTNLLYTKSMTPEHGIEVFWPGIVLKVQFRK